MKNQTSSFVFDFIDYDVFEERLVVSFVEIKNFKYFISTFKKFLNFFKFVDIIDSICLFRLF